MFMKKCCFFAVMMVAVFALQSQTVIFEDNFDGYTAGVQLCLQNNDDWTTWSNAPGGNEDPMVSDEQAETSSNSLKLEGDNDLIYKFLNQTTGVYKIEFDYFVPSSGAGAYFNVQHYASPGQQWAFEVYFRNNGQGYLLAGSNTQNAFNYPVDQWFHIICEIDLNNDETTLTINGTLVKTWPFHYQAGNTSGICQLGSINFYAGSPENASGTYYLDNYMFWEIVPQTPGKFVISSEEPIVKTVTIGIDETELLNLSNPGGASIDYEIVAVYDIAEVNATSTGQKTITYIGMPGSSGVGFTNQSIYTVAAGYSPSMLKDHIGKTVRKYDVNLNNVANILTAKLCIWKMAPMGMPSLEPPIYEQEIAVSSLYDGINSIDLEEPWLIDGGYIYIGLDMTVVPGDNTEFVSVGTDNTPENQCNKLGRLYRSSVAWSAISGLDGYWEMNIFVDGTPIKPWINFDHTSATLQPGNDKDLTITFGASDILEDCVKDAHLYFFSNDYSNDKEETVIEVTVTFVQGDEVEYTIEITTQSGDSPAGANVTLSNAYNNYTDISTDEGVTFSNVRCGTYSLNVNLEGYKEYNETITITEAGTHSVVLVPLSINSYEYGFDLYPNPATTFINVEVANIHTVELYTLMGQKVFSHQFSGDKVEISTANLSAGTYMVKVINAEGKTATQKVIVQ